MSNCSQSQPNIFFVNILEWMLTYSYLEQSQYQSSWLTLSTNSKIAAIPSHNQDGPLKRILETQITITRFRLLSSKRLSRIYCHSHVSHFLQNDTWTETLSTSTMSFSLQIRHFSSKGSSTMSFSLQIRHFSSKGRSNPNETIRFF